VDQGDDDLGDRPDPVEPQGKDDLGAERDHKLVADVLTLAMVVFSERHVRT
jgi:hypothetical protein